MASIEATPSDLFQACTILFGPDATISADFLRYLRMSGLRAAYRKKALETHPDRAVALDEASGLLEERFKEVNLAYERLTAFVEAPWKCVAIEDAHGGGSSCHGPAGGGEGTPRQGRAWRRERLSEQFHEGALPSRRLPLGRFLYYSGLIPRKALIEAIVWQKGQRPALGRIAMQWSWLFDEDVWKILRNRRPGEKFGECALRKGYITAYQLWVLLGRQRMLQPRIGQFFLDQDILSGRDLDRCVEELKTHNRRFWND